MGMTRLSGVPARFAHAIRKTGGKSQLARCYHGLGMEEFDGAAPEPGRYGAAAFAYSRCESQLSATFRSGIPLRAKLSLFDRSRPAAHFAASATTESSSCSMVSRTPRNLASPLFPIAKAAFRRKPRRLVRRTCKH